MVTFDRSMLVLFINGVETASIDATDRYKESVNTPLENCGSASNAIPGEFNGNIYDVRYYNHVLTESEISDIYQNNTILGDEVLRMPLSGTDVTRTEGFSHEYCNI